MQTISQSLIEEIIDALKMVGPFGSIEIYVQNSVVTQITMRNIRKTNVNLPNGNGKTDGHLEPPIMKNRT